MNRERFGRIKALSVELKIAVILLAILVVVVANMAVVIHFQGEIQADSTAVDVAGEQRMLSQQIAWHATRLAQEPDSTEARADLRAAIDRYEANLAALATGGEVSGKQVSAVPESAEPALADEQDAWEEYKDHAETVLAADPDSQEFDRSVEYIETHAETVVAVSDELAVAISDHNSDRIVYMQQLQGVFLIGLLGIAAAGFLFTRRYISQPLVELTENAKALENGEFETEITTYARNGNDEISLLATQFAKMRDHLRERTRERKRHIDVLQRILRHNLRNDLNVVLGRAEHITTITDDDTIKQSASKIKQNATDLARLGEEAKTAEKVLKEPTTIEPTNATPIITDIAGTYDQRFESASITLDIPAELQLAVDENFEIVLENLIDNAIRHNATSAPQVGIRAESAESGTVTLAVADNGPTISDAERKIIAEDDEITPLNHGSGLGLWIIKWIVESYDGDIEIKTNDAGGNTILLHLTDGQNASATTATSTSEQGSRPNHMTARST